MAEDTSIQLITGPNMSGKSTYMRQLAMTAVVDPAGVLCTSRKRLFTDFDAIFTRIEQQMTWFRVSQPLWWRMMEANNAISHATKNSHSL